MEHDVCPLITGSDHLGGGVDFPLCDHIRDPFCVLVTDAKPQVQTAPPLLPIDGSGGCPHEASSLTTRSSPERSAVKSGW